jgi:transcription initiation factor TFIID TATA-box-binding protein
MFSIRIENVVASTSLSPELDLQSIALSLDKAEYEPEQFPGLIYRLKEPKTALLLFRSGKAVCTGGKSMNQVNQSIRIVSDLIRKTKQKVLLHPVVQVQNIVATANLGSELNLNAIAVTLGLDRVEYEPEQFPGLVCRLKDPAVVILLFGSGKLVCTGARRPADISRAVQQIASELQRADLLREPTPRAPAQPTRPKRTSRVPSAVPAPAAGNLRATTESHESVPTPAS